MDIQITDELLSTAQIAAWMYNQKFENTEGKEKPFTPKAFPGKAITILIPQPNYQIEIYFDADACQWDSKLVVDGKFMKLEPDQMEDFFKSEFYEKMIASLSKKWPTTDPNYGKMFAAIQSKSLRVGVIPEYELEEASNGGVITELEHHHNVNQPNKRKDLANKDVTGDGKRDYTGSGRKIVSFSDSAVSSKASKYYCWPRKGKEFKWNTWKEWKKQKPFCKMTFKHNGREYMVQAALFDEQFDNRGFRGADVDWEPPFAWLSPGECESAMKLDCVQKFLRQCKKRVKKYLSMTPEEVFEKIDKKERVTLKEIQKTQRVIRHCIDVLFNKGQKDNYCYKD